MEGKLNRRHKIAQIRNKGAAFCRLVTVQRCAAHLCTQAIQQICRKLAVHCLILHDVVRPGRFGTKVVLG